MSDWKATNPFGPGGKVRAQRGSLTPWRLCWLAGLPLEGPGLPGPGSFACDCGEGGGGRFGACCFTCLSCDGRWGIPFGCVRLGCLCCGRDCESILTARHTNATKTIQGNRLEKIFVKPSLVRKKNNFVAILQYFEYLFSILFFNSSILIFSSIKFKSIYFLCSLNNLYLKEYYQGLTLKKKLHIKIVGLIEKTNQNLGSWSIRVMMKKEKHFSRRILVLIGWGSEKWS